MHELVPILKRFEGSKIKGSGGVWRIEGSSVAIEECKTLLLDAICSRSQPFVRYDESPVDIPELKGMVGVAVNTWQLPAHAPASTVLSWLHLGNWHLYVAAAPIATMPDLCRSSDFEVERFLTLSGASVVIDSFHDDVLWVVGFRNPSI